MFPKTLSKDRSGFQQDDALIEAQKDLWLKITHETWQFHREYTFWKRIIPIEILTNHFYYSWSLANFWANWSHIRTKINIFLISSAISKILLDKKILLSLQLTACYFFSTTKRIYACIFILHFFNKVIYDLSRQPRMSSRWKNTSTNAKKNFSWNRRRSQNSRKVKWAVLKYTENA